MALLEILAVGAIGWVAHQMKKDHEEELRRQSISCTFSDGVTEAEFYEIVMKAAKPIKRLKVDIHGPVIYGTVRTQSGINTWNFKIDFNDYGHLTGAYWISRENHDSSIPEHLANTIREML